METLAFYTLSVIPASSALFFAALAPQLKYDHPVFKTAAPDSFTNLMSSAYSPP
jgi:hypothetical protein